MTEILTTNSGFFPRPDYLIDAYKKVGGLQKEGMDEEVREELIDEIKKARTEILDIQEKSGMDIVTEGQLHWDDLLAYPATKIDGVEMGGLIRYYSTNRFYRRPLVNSSLETDGILIEEYKEAVDKTEKKVKPILPGPLTFSDLLENQYYDSESEMQDRVIDILISEIQRLEDAGANVIQLDEPYLTSADDIDLTPISIVTEKTDVEIEIHSNFGEINNHYPDLLNSCNWISLDLTRENQNWEALKEYGAAEKLSAGLINTKNTKMETEKQIKSDLDKIIEHSSPEKLYLTTNTGFDFLPWKIMLKKVKLLGSDNYDR